MQSSLREDYLEAIEVFTEKNHHSPSGTEIAAVMGKPPLLVQEDLVSLTGSGDITVDREGRISLTAQGRATGITVIKKHATLQCFLSEMLGMDALTASSEACTLEHAVSDETIDRLGKYLQKPEISPVGSSGSPGPGGEWHGDSTCEGAAPLSLLDFDEGEELIVRSILGRSCAKRLLDLGVVPGERVTIRRKLKNLSLVIQVKGCDVALSPEIAAAVCVERCA